MLSLVEYVPVVVLSAGFPVAQKADPLEWDPFQMAQVQRPSHASPRRQVRESHTSCLLPHKAAIKVDQMPALCLLSLQSRPRGQLQLIFGLF